MVNIGDKVKIIDAKAGAFGANGLIGYVTEKKSSNGFMLDEDGINIETEKGIWRVSLEADLEIIEKKNKELTIEIW